MVGAFLRTGRRYSSNRVVTRNEWVSVLVRVSIGHEMDLNSVAIKIPVGRTCSTVRTVPGHLRRFGTTKP
jgi:hypothetical protein